MKKLLGGLTAAIVLSTSASANTLAVVNSDFEDPSFDTNIFVGSGNYGWGATGYGFDYPAGANFGVGTFEFNDGIYSGAMYGKRAGVVGEGATLFQDLGIAIEANTTYNISALITNRTDFTSFGGAVGFYAGGDPANIIAQMALSTPTVDGKFEFQSFFFDAPTFANFIDQQLGFFFTGTFGQISVDNITIATSQFESLQTENVLVNPVPGAVWFFGSGLFAAAGFFRRRKSLSHSS